MSQFWDPWQGMGAVPCAPTPNICPPTYANLEGTDHNRYSGNARQVDSASAETLLNVKMPPYIALGLEGGATIQVSVRDTGDEIGANAATANAKLVMDLGWATDAYEGTETIDIQHGTILTVLGATAVNAKVRFESAVDGAPLLVWRFKEVRAAVTWQTSISPKAARYMAPGLTLAGARSAMVPIPKHASSMIVLSNTPGLLPVMLAEFFTTNNVATLRYATTNPNANGTPLDGVDFVALTGAAQVAYPSFEMWL